MAHRIICVYLRIFPISLILEGYIQITVSITTVQEKSKQSTSFVISFKDGDHFSRVLDENF